MTLPEIIKQLQADLKRLGKRGKTEAVSIWFKGEKLLLTDIGVDNQFLLQTYTSEPDSEPTEPKMPDQP